MSAEAGTRHPAAPGGLDPRGPAERRSKPAPSRSPEQSGGVARRDGLRGKDPGRDGIAQDIRDDIEHDLRDESLPPRPGERFRAIFISDLHLGTAGCQAGHLLDFLRAHESDSLYLVGDIVDAWQLRRRWTWRAEHNEVIQEVLRKSREGTRVVFVPGNHDEAARQFDGLSFGGIRVENESEHLLLDGRRLWVIHGDLFDGVVQHVRWVAHLGDQLYMFTLWLNRHLNRIRHRLGFGYWSLSQYLKHKVKDAVGFICDFEQAVARETRRRDYDGVVCGHIHKAGIRTIDGVLYCNDGDWVESLTALVETTSGRLMIVEWRPAGWRDGDETPQQSARVLETA